MATHDITITYPDGAADRILAALKHHATGTAENPEPTNAEALAWFDDYVRRQLKTLVKNYELDQAMQAVDTAPDVT